MSKRGENIRKRNDGRWESRLLNKNTGKYKYFYGKTYSEVKQKRYEYDILFQKGIKHNNCKVYLSLAFEQWLSDIKNKVKQSTYSNYESIIRLYLLPLFGNIDLKMLNAHQINNIMSEWFKFNGTGLSLKYIHDILSVLKASLIWITNKYEHVINVDEIMSVSSEKKDISILSSFEQNKLIRYLLEPSDYSRIGIILCLYTGMRIGEICALKWSDIHLNEGYIDINKTMYRVKNIDKVTVCNKIPKTIISIGKPKTDSSARKIPICDFILDLISDTKAHDSNNYFLTDSERYIEPRTYQNRFKKYLQEAGIQAVNFHILRHTFATNCINAGCDVKSVSEILGHSSVKITLDRYVHPSMESKKKQLDRLTVYNF